MNRKELTKIFMMISNLKNPLVSRIYIKNNSALKGLMHLYFTCRIDLTPEDPRWVGAWWLGYVIAGFMGITVALFMCCFPREFPGNIADTPVHTKHLYNILYNVGPTLKTLG